MNVEYHELRIRNAEKRDCVQLAKWWNDGKVMAHAGFANGLGTSAAEIEHQIADDSNDTKRRLVIEYQHVLIGEMSFYVYKNARYDAWRNQLGELQSCVDYELTKHDFCNWTNR